MRPTNDKPPATHVAGGSHCNRSAASKAALRNYSLAFTAAALAALWRYPLREPPPVQGRDPWLNVPSSLRNALGDADTRASFDFDGDGTDEVCRIVSGQPTYYLCSSNVAVYYGTLDEPGLRDWPRDWVDWDGDGRKDWCRIVGAIRGAKQLRCNFSDGKTLEASAISGDIDAGYPIRTSYTPVVRASRTNNELLPYHRQLRLPRVERMSSRGRPWLRPQ